MSSAFPPVAAAPGSGAPPVPLVTVIVRSMARPTLQAALDSLAAQTYPSVDILVVAASGPTHPTPGERAGAHRVRLVRPDAPLQRAAAANAGLDAAAGDWITFLDDDDIFLPGHVAGLMAACAEASQNRVVHSYARAIFRDGRVERVGHPHALMELFDRNYLSLSTAVFSRTLVEAGCRFDESLELLEDWDFSLQLAQHTFFHFTPLETFVWHADVGSSGAGGALNQDHERFARFRDRVYAKWSAVRDEHVDRTIATLQVAEQQVRTGNFAAAQASCHTVLGFSQNNPYALNLLAMSHRASGNLAQARAVQELAVAVHPHDAGFLHNLALLYAATGDLAGAMSATTRALAIDPAFPPAQRLQAQLAAAASPVAPPR